MPKSLFSRTAVLACAVAVVTALGGCATTPAGRVGNPAQVAANTPSNPDCIRETGTRIKVPAGQCVNLPGSSYTQQDIERTGQVNVGAALEMMDPRFSR